MKILLDECITKRLKQQLLEYHVFTVVELGLSGIKNGQLMAYCVANNIDILVTIDKNLMHQQNLDKYAITIVVLNSYTSKLEELVEFIPILKAKIPNLQKNKAYLIDK